MMLAFLATLSAKEFFMSGSTRLLIAAKWKMNGMLQERLSFVSDFAEHPSP